jgi:hypothetical protein
MAFSNVQWFEVGVIGRLGNIGGIVDNHCLNFILLMICNGVCRYYEPCHPIQLFNIFLRICVDDQR